jgi:hypothetical protein
MIIGEYETLRVKKVEVLEIGLRKKRKKRMEENSSIVKHLSGVLAGSFHRRVPPEITEKRELGPNIRN